MDANDRFARVRQLFEAVLDEPPGVRDDILSAACGDDEELRREVGSLLAAHGEAGTFLEKPAARVAGLKEPSTPLSLLPGDRVGPFTVVGMLGSGGMGEVYRAEDTRLGREVALKLLPADLATDPQRLARFERESRMLAALTHPNIAAIYSVEHLDGLRLLVLELVVGPTLAECIAQGPLPPASALSIARQLASALGAAHARGIVHRDLKPSNVKLTPGGTVKLLDFGLAKQHDAAGSRDDPRFRTTLGVILGTWGYMSPEQARGRPVDRQADIWAFGCLVFELLAGRRAFGGETPSDTIAAVLEREPGWSWLPETLPTDVRHMLERCLEKDPERRLHDIDEARRVLDVQPESAGHGEAARASRVTTRSRRAAALTLVAALVVAGIGLGWRSLGVWGFGARNADAGGQVDTRIAGSGSGLLGPASSDDRVSTAFSERIFRSLAVLPFDRADGGDSDVDHLSEGLSEGLIDRLSQLPDLKVIARSSSFRYKAGEIDPRTAGRALGVEALVVGRVSRRGDELLVRAELVDARLGTQVWSEQFRRPARELQDVQEEIVYTIVQRLHVRLTAGQQERLARSATVSHQAYLLYLTGLYHLRRGTADELKKAIDHGREAVAIDSTFARAWLLIAQAHWALSGNSVADPGVALPRARAAVLRALALDETLAEAHLSLAMLEQDTWEWKEAERQFTRAIELNPSLASAHGQYGRFLSVLGRFDEALAAVRRAQALDPLQSTWRAREGVILYFARRYAEAIEQLQYAVSSEPGRPVPLYFLGFVHDSAGDHERAIEMLRQAIAIEPTFTSARAALGCALANSGRKADARAELENLRRGSEYVSPTELATLHIALDEKEDALALLEQAYAARDLQLQYLNVVPHFDALRAEPRFQQVVRLVGLPQEGPLIQFDLHGSQPRQK